MANQIIPQRSEVPEEYTWNLKDLYESDQAWNEEYEALKALPKQIAAFRGTLGRSAEDLLAWFRLQDQVEERLSRLYGYASCKGDEDTGNSFYQDMRGKAMSTLVTISSAAAFATPEIMEIPEDTLNRSTPPSRSWRPTAAACIRSAAARPISSPLPRRSCWPPPAKWPTPLRTWPACSATPIWSILTWWTRPAMPIS